MKIHCLFEIIRILNNNNCVSATQISNALKITTRTVYRYVEELITNGIPINSTKGRYGGFSLDKDYKTSKYRLKV